MSLSPYYPRLGVNIDHVATVRNARGGAFPDPVRAALLAEKSGADGVTAHLREDRRHISDADIRLLCERVKVPLNLEMAPTDEMLAIALRHVPASVCIVPEKREEKTTEGGYGVAENAALIKGMIARLKVKHIKVSLFIDPEFKQIEASRAVGADIVEFHTGEYCLAAERDEADKKRTLSALKEAFEYAHRQGLKVHAGHGLNYKTAAEISALPYVEELNIGHFMIGEAIFCGLETVIQQMRDAMAKGFEKRAA